MKNPIAIHKTVKAIENNCHTHKDKGIRFFPSGLCKRINKCPVNIMQQPENNKKILRQAFLIRGNKKVCH
jgi:hypothetical protein